MAIQTKGVIHSQAQSDFVRILCDQRIPKVTRFLDGTDLLNFEERTCRFIRYGVPKQPFQNFLIGKATIPEGEDRLSIFMMVEKLVRSPAFPLRLPKFAKSCSFSEAVQAMKDLRRRLHSVENYFSPTTIEELRNQYWAIWQLTNLSHQWFRSIQVRKLITDKDQPQQVEIDKEQQQQIEPEVLDLIEGLSNRFWAFWQWNHPSQHRRPPTRIERRITNKTQAQQVEAEKLSFKHLRNRAWDTSVQIGECKIEGVVYQVRARHWYQDFRDKCQETVKGKFYGYTVIYLTRNPQEPVRTKKSIGDEFYHGNWTYVKIIHSWKNYGKKFYYSPFDNSEQDCYWDKRRDEVARPDVFQVDFNFRDLSSGEAYREKGLNRLHHLKIMQVVFEILLRSEQPITRLNGDSNRADAAVLFASGMVDSHVQGRDWGILTEVETHREQHGTLFPPYRNYGGLRVSIMRSKLESGETRPHVPIFEGKSWKQIIKESPILFGSGPVVPLYWSAPPACLKGRLRWDDSLMAAEAGPSSSAIASSSTAPLAASSSSDPAMGG